MNKSSKRRIVISQKYKDKVIQHFELFLTGAEAPVRELNVQMPETGISGIE